MFLNFSNHPSENWQKKQYDAALEYGEIVDLPFPNIPARSSESDIRKIAAEYLDKIESLRPDVVFLAGEFTFVYMMVEELRERGIKVVSSATERIAEETKLADGTMQKNVRFDFVRFRAYTKYRTELLGISKNGVYVRNRWTSHLHEQDRHMKDLLAEAIRQTEIDLEEGEEQTYTREFDFVIGTSNCIPEEQYRGEVVNVYRRNRTGKTPMVKDTPPVNSKKLNFAVLKTDDDEAVCITAYFGERAPREPWDPHIETAEELEYAKQFWNTHALIYDEEQIDKERM